MESAMWTPQTGDKEFNIFLVEYIEHVVYSVHIWIPDTYQVHLLFTRCIGSDVLSVGSFFLGCFFSILFFRVQILHSVKKTNILKNGILNICFLTLC